MRLTNTVTGEHFLVVRMADRYHYTLHEEGTHNWVRMNHEQYAKFRMKAEIKEVEEEV